MANYPDRCQHLKINGTQCGSPALRRNRFCFFHKRFQDERIKLSADRARRGVATFVLPVLEDANSIQIALMQVMRLLVSQQIEHKTASLLLYALQTASTNLRMTNFKALTNDVILDPRDVADTPLDEHIWEDEDFDETDEVQTAADRAIEELETVRKEKEEKAKWRLWAEMQYPDPFIKKPVAPVVAPPPLPNLKKPASSSSPEEIRAEISDMVREQFLPAMAKKFTPQPTTQQTKGGNKGQIRNQIDEERSVPKRFVEGYGFSRTVNAQTKDRALAPEGFAAYTTIEIRGKDSLLATDFSSLRERDFFA